MKAACKIWIDNNGKAFGEGPCRLLKLIEKMGSLHQAAMEMGMSYRKAWMMLHRSEEKLGVKLLERRIGGKSGGGSKITPSGIQIIRQYDHFHEEATKSIDTLYNKYFGDFISKS